MTGETHLFLHLGSKDDVPTILRRIQEHREPVVVVDCTNQERVRSQGQLRRLIAAAGADLGKKVVFRAVAGGEHDVLTEVPRPTRRAAVGAHAWSEAIGPRVRAGGSAARPSLRHLLPRAGTRHGSPPWLVLPAFAVLAGALLAIVMLFVLPRARVTIAARAEPLVTDLAVTLDGRAAVASVERGILPARTVLVEEDFADTFPVQTIVERGERATGTVELVNMTGSPQPIRSGSRLESASGVIARTARGVILPPQGRVAVAVQADAGGTKGNLAPQRLTLPGLDEASRRLMYGEVVEGLAGGTDRPVTEVGQADIDRATETLRQRAEDDLRERIRALVNATEGAPPPSGQWLDRPELVRVEVDEVRSSAAAGTPAPEIALTARIRGEALTVDLEVLRAFLLELLTLQAGSGREVGASAIPLDDVKVLDLRWDVQRAEMSLHVEAVSQPALEEAEIARRLIGRDAADAETFLKNLPGVRDATVSLSPPWVRSVPSNLRNVHVRITAD